MEDAQLISRDGGQNWPGGGFVWLGYGFRLKRLMFRRLSEILEMRGYSPMQFPRVVPNSIIQAVCDNIVDLSGGTYWLSEGRSGDVQGTGRYANSTNDALLSYHLSTLSRKQGVDYPFKAYTHHQMIRYHRGRTRPFFNSDENTDLYEAYFVSPNESDVNKEFLELTEVATQFFNDLGMSFHIVEQSMWGNKPIASAVNSLQTFSIPPSGSVRLFSIYYHGQTFSRLFNLTDGKGHGRRPINQIGFGMWEGALLPMLDHFSDEYGFVLPSEICPHHVVILPRDENEYKTALELQSVLNDFRVHIDTRFSKRKKRLSNSRFLRALALHLKQGSPFRISFSNQNELRISRRDNLQVREIPLRAAKDHIRHGLLEYDVQCAERSREYLQANVRHVKDLSESNRLFNEGKMSLVPHCGFLDCAQSFEKKALGEFLGYVRDQQPSGSCIECSAIAKRYGLVGRRAPTP